MFVKALLPTKPNARRREDQIIVVGYMTGFLERLTPSALHRLRRVVEDEMLKMGFPKEHIKSPMGEREIDRMIDTYTQEAAEGLIMRGMDDGLIERKVSR